MATRWNALGALAGKFVKEADSSLASMSADLDAATASGSPWDLSVRKQREDVARVYRELQEEFPDLDLTQFERIDRQLQELLALGEDDSMTNAAVGTIRMQRTDLLSKLLDNRRKQFRARDELAKRLTADLGGAIRVNVEFQGQRDSLLETLAGFKTKVRQDALKALADDPSTTPEGLGWALIDGPAEMAGKFPVSASQASALCERLAMGATSWHFRSSESLTR